MLKQKSVAVLNQEVISDCQKLVLLFDLSLCVCKRERGGGGGERKREETELKAKESIICIIHWHKERNI